MSGANKLLVEPVGARQILGRFKQIPNPTNKFERLFRVEFLLVTLLDEKCDSQVGTKVVDQFHGVF